LRNHDNNQSEFSEGLLSFELKRCAPVLAKTGACFLPLTNTLHYG